MAGALSKRSRLGRYELFHEIGAGGMATVHLGRVAGGTESAPTLAIKRLHAQFARDPAFSLMFLDEARLAACIRHPNVVATHEVVATGGELLLVMPYVPGLSLSRVLRIVRSSERIIPLPIALAIAKGVLEGLHAAHEAHAEDGQPLSIVHRDVSPQNVLVGADGVARLLDFGVAKAVGRLHTTRHGEIKGKIPYMPPEQLDGTVSRQTDIYAASVLLWELLTGEHPFRASSDAETIKRVLFDPVIAPGKIRKDLPRELDWVTLRGLERDPDQRYRTAHEMAAALDAFAPIATPAEVATWLDEIAAEPLREDRARASEIAAMSSTGAMAISGVVEPRRARPGLAMRLALTATALIVVGIGVAALRMGRPVARAAPVAASSTAPPDPLPAEPALPEPSSAPVAATSSVPHRAPVARPSPARSAPKPKPQCAPPYVTDAVGHKHFKEECL
jgi:eukaryotic-like serine/threonine-protein kinase